MRFFLHVTGLFIKYYPFEKRCKIWLRIIEMGPWFINGCVRQWRIGKCWFQADWTWWRSNTVMSSEAPHFWRHRVMPFLEITTCKASPTFLSFLSLKVKCKGLLDPIWIRIIEDINIWECNGHFETKDRPDFAWISEKIHWISGNFWITDKFTKISWKTTLFWLYRALLKFWYIKKMYFLCSFVIWYLMLESYCVIERKYEGYRKRGEKTPCHREENYGISASVSDMTNWWPQKGNQVVLYWCLWCSLFKMGLKSLQTSFWS